MTVSAVWQARNPKTWTKLEEKIYFLTICSQQPSIVILSLQSGNPKTWTKLEEEIYFLTICSQQASIVFRSLQSGNPKTWTKLEEEMLRGQKLQGVATSNEVQEVCLM